MNPFDLRGPQFLLFYVILAAVVIGVLLLLRYQREVMAGSAMPPISDPYKIAFLRAGKNETLRVAELCLIDRGYLKVTEDDKIANAQKPEAKFLTDPLNRKILQYYAEPLSPDKIFELSNFDSVMDSYQAELERLDLMPGQELKERRLAECLCGGLLLGGVTVSKMVVAASAGRSNVGFLFALTVVLIIGISVIYGKRRTAKGDAYLSGLAELIPDPSSAQSTAELAIGAAVFGIGAIPVSYPNRDRIFGKASKKSGDSGSSGCGSSCGSSSSGDSGGDSGSGSDSSGDSGGGSSCGGGGGGCGGCGS